MLKKSIRISRADGLEARSFAKLVQVASKYDSRIYMETVRMKRKLSVSLRDFLLRIPQFEQ